MFKIYALIQVLSNDSYQNISKNNFPLNNELVKFLTTATMIYASVLFILPLLFKTSEAKISNENCDTLDTEIHLTKGNIKT